jgi:hypothetical protein
MNELGREIRDGAARLEIPLSAILYLLHAQALPSPAENAPLSRIVP